MKKNALEKNGRYTNLAKEVILNFPITAPDSGLIATHVKTLSLPTALWNYRYRLLPLFS